MSRITPVTPENASGQVKEVYDSLTKKMGGVKNIFQNMGTSAAVLEGYLGLSGAAAKTSFDAKMREKIALLVAELNGCEYCLAAHTAIAQMNGLEDPQILQSRRAEAEDGKTKAILDFTKLVVESKANVSSEDVAAFKAAGGSDKEITELILLISLNLFTNYFNHVIDTDIDFPKAPALG